MPTETVYGLAARLDDLSAVAAVFQAKERPADDPLIVHLGPHLLGPDPLSALKRQGLVPDLPEPQAQAAARLMAAFWPGPMTLVLPRGPAVHPSITAGLPEVALRLPAHPIAQTLVDATGVGLVAPSANRFGRISPTTADAVLGELGGRIAAVVDGGPCSVGVESTVLRVRADGGTDRLRPGAVTDAQVTSLLGASPSVPRGQQGPSPSPGQSASHYAPTTPLHLAPAFALDHRPRRVAVLGWRDPDALRHNLTARGHQVGAFEALAPDGDPSGAAHRLYALLRSLDASGCDAIVAEAIPEGSGLLDALRDRLDRASRS